jgi:hypothetical protein
MNAPEDGAIPQWQFEYFTRRLEALRRTARRLPAAMGFLRPSITQAHLICV